ncbi:hypothetical protein AAHA92_29062 [Salvia divinorum]|uniref:Uncharacterized protein n=1 Tax=Salvia divinorum TaxID=28513 RepID=A0ABD1FXJ2_SALDI
MQLRRSVVYIDTKKLNLCPTRNSCSITALKHGVAAAEAGGLPANYRRDGSLATASNAARANVNTESIARMGQRWRIGSKDGTAARSRQQQCHGRDVREWRGRLAPVLTATQCEAAAAVRRVSRWRRDASREREALCSDGSPFEFGADR